jgi:site-specific recombinase XerD
MSTTGFGRARQRLLDDHIEPFLQHLRDTGYAERTLRKKRTIARAFARWAKRQGIATVNLNDGHVDAFLRRLPRGGKSRLKFELGGVRLFLGYLRATAGLQCPAPQAPVSSTASLLQQYENHLRKDRGLAENSLRVYLPLIRTFLASKFAGSGFPQSLKALTIRDFVIAQTRSRSAEYVRLLATALRSFCRFLFLSGHMPADLSSSVPRVCTYRQSTPPAFLAPEEVMRVLAAMDRSTPRGRRDYAILLLLARLGLRASEIVSLELDDVRWRTAEIVVRGKGRMVERLPLLRDIGEALATYLRKDRGASKSRRIFLRMWAPRVGLTGPAAVGHIVRLALAQAGIRRSGRGAAHLFRHGLATRMIRHGASLSEIAEVLRHRSQMTTSGYTQVAFEALRGVAQPWPTRGGAR